MKLMLVSLPYATETNLKAHLPVQRYPPLGLLYLASAIRKEGFEVKVIDAPAMNWDIQQIYDTIMESSPDVIGIYITSFVLNQAYSLISRIKKMVKTCIVLGGPHITHNPASVRELGTDYGVAGDCEESLVKLLRAIPDKHKIKKVQGIIYSDKGKIKTGKRHPLKNLDSLPFPDRSLVTGKRYYSPLFDGKITTMVSSRGCVNDCIFCALPNKGIFKVRSPKNVIAEMEWLEKEGYKYIEMQDDFFTLDKKRIGDICALVLKNGLKIKWGCETKIESLDEKLLGMMKEAGCLNIRFGIEAASERIRNRVIGKSIDENYAYKLIMYARKLGMCTDAHFTIGNPTETMAEMEATLALALKLNPDYVDFHLLMLIPGSRLFNIALKESKISADVWAKVQEDGKVPFYYPDDITPEQLVEFQKKAYHKFYFRFKRMISEITRVRSLKDFYSRLKCGLIIFRQ